MITAAHPLHSHSGSTLPKLLIVCRARLMDATRATHMVLPASTTATDPVTEVDSIKFRT